MAAIENWRQVLRSEVSGGGVAGVSEGKMGDKTKGKGEGTWLLN